MNYESRLSPADASGANPTAHADLAWVNEAEAEQRRKRRTIILVGIGLAVALLLAALWFMQSGDNAEAAPKGAAAAAGGADGETAGEAPRVTVFVPGRQIVESAISATGSLAARREMPVGVAGEGGQVTRVLVEAGQWVRAGQVMAVVDRQVQMQQLAQLEASIRVAQADANLAQSELNRAQALVERGFISRADIERRTAQRDAAAARVRVARAQLAESRARTGRLDVRAPAAGLVLERNVEPGQVVSAGSGVLFRMARGGEMEMLAQLSEADLARVGVGTRAMVTPVGAANAVQGQVWQLSPVIDPQSRQGTARIAIPYSAGIRPGGFAQATIIAGTAQVPLLPESAVMSDEQGDYVYIVGPDNKATRRAVTSGAVNNQGVPIIAGLNGTERVVRNAGAFLSEGDVISPVLERPAAQAATAAQPAPAATPAR